MKPGINAKESLDDNVGALIHVEGHLLNALLGNLFDGTSAIGQSVQLSFLQSVVQFLRVAVQTQRGVLAIGGEQVGSCPLDVGQPAVSGVGGMLQNALSDSNVAGVTDISI